MSVYRVERTGDGRVISWNGKPIHYRINWQHFSGSQRTTINEAIADVCPRVGSGHTNDGQTTKKPMNGKAVHLLGEVTKLYVYAKDFALIDGANVNALASVDKHNIGDELVGAVMFFNTRQLNEGDDFKAICYHEMGHVVGLEHPTAADQLMSPVLTGLPWKWGDLAGFDVLKAAH